MARDKCQDGEWREIESKGLMQNSGAQVLSDKFELYLKDQWKWSHVKRWALQKDNLVRVCSMDQREGDRNGEPSYMAIVTLQEKR